MKWDTIEHIAKSMKSSDDTATKQFYYSVTELAAMLGSTPKSVTAFLHEKCVPHYRPNRAKLYFLPEVLEEIEKTRWKTG